MRDDGAPAARLSRLTRRASLWPRGGLVVSHAAQSWATRDRTLLLMHQSYWRLA